MSFNWFSLVSPFMSLSSVVSVYSVNSLKIYGPACMVVFNRINHLLCTSVVTGCAGSIGVGKIVEYT